MLVVKSLTVRFRRHGAPSLTVLEGLDLAAPRGAVTGICGASGAGKSLIAAAIAGTLPRNADVSGRILVDGAPPSRGGIALAPQGLDALDPLATVGAQIARFARLADRTEDPAALLPRLGLAPTVAQAWPHELSGGMARRACLATALATGAGWLIADEPTAGLDAAAAERIMALLGTLASDGYGVLVISHDLPRLAAVAGEITVLQEGCAVETAPASAFRGNGEALRKPFARRLWQAQNVCPAC
ncbi:ABC transporter ATP-binding protein (plasmid) [Brevirhabdus pacifica]|uniref:Nickel import system ATP-binding protein NikD n=1 Tax=Brevirhabdus pacifica TaxID=1267768 RepID=A0A1P8QXX9_9RHOB|nr:ATP-binding cassette domain-containing protein [Brevirhabdus pacifica]APX91215.1 ABC transporter ATP-binding protein [Brevirhabdus pacifica]OWU74125.1 ABC transporter ATP-binding protein [Loktanella sp. 22II-4b]PJJ78866.1 peptide/nickel transport system ATP-binding protein [Brevirhabdus pacifica]